MHKYSMRYDVKVVSWTQPWKQPAAMNHICDGWKCYWLWHVVAPAATDVTNNVIASKIASLSCRCELYY